MFDQGINQDFGFENSIMGNNNVINNDMNVDVEMMGYNNSMVQPNMMNNMNEGVQQRVVNRTFVHEVPHTCPIHTRIINHHVYKHTYRPQYTCSEENTVSNMQCGSCCNYR